MKKSCTSCNLNVSINNLLSPLICTIVCICLQLSSNVKGQVPVGGGADDGTGAANRRVAYGIMFANPMAAAASAPYPVYQIPMQGMQQPFYGAYGGQGYPSPSPMGWMQPSASMQMPYAAATGYGHPGLAAGYGNPVQGGYFGQQMAGTPTAYSGYSPLTMIGRILGASSRKGSSLSSLTKPTDDVKALEELIRML